MVMFQETRSAYYETLSTRMMRVRLGYEGINNLRAEKSNGVTCWIEPTLLPDKVYMSMGENGGFSRGYDEDARILCLEYGGGEQRANFYVPYRSGHAEADNRRRWFNKAIKGTVELSQTQGVPLNICMDGNMVLNPVNDISSKHPLTVLKKNGWFTQEDHEFCKELISCGGKEKLLYDAFVEKRERRHGRGPFGGIDYGSLTSTGLCMGVIVQMKIDNCVYNSKEGVKKMINCECRGFFGSDHKLLKVVEAGRPCSEGRREFAIKGWLYVKELQTLPKGKSTGQSNLFNQLFKRWKDIALNIRPVEAESERLLSSKYMERDWHHLFQGGKQGRCDVRITRNPIAIRRAIMEELTNNLRDSAAGIPKISLSRACEHLETEKQITLTSLELESLIRQKRPQWFLEIEEAKGRMAYATHGHLSFQFKKMQALTQKRVTADSIKIEFRDVETFLYTLQRGPAAYFFTLENHEVEALDPGSTHFQINLHQYLLDDPDRTVWLLKDGWLAVEDHGFGKDELAIYGKSISVAQARTLSVMKKGVSSFINTRGGCLRKHFGIYRGIGNVGVASQSTFGEQQWEVEAIFRGYDVITRQFRSMCRTLSQVNPTAFEVLTPVGGTVCEGFVTSQSNVFLVSLEEGAEVEKAIRKNAELDQPLNTKESFTENFRQRLETQESNILSPAGDFAVLHPGELFRFSKAVAILYGGHYIPLESKPGMEFMKSTIRDYDFYGGKIKKCFEKEKTASVNLHNLCRESVIGKWEDGQCTQQKDPQSRAEERKGEQTQSEEVGGELNMATTAPSVDKRMMRKEGKAAYDETLKLMKSRVCALEEVSVTVTHIDINRETKGVELTMSTDDLPEEIHEVDLMIEFTEGDNVGLWLPAALCRFQRMEHTEGGVCVTRINLPCGPLEAAGDEEIINAYENIRVKVSNICNLELDARTPEALENEYRRLLGEDTNSEGGTKILIGVELALGNNQIGVDNLGGYPEEKGAGDQTQTYGWKSLKGECQQLALELVENYIQKRYTSEARKGKGPTPRRSEHTDKFRKLNLGEGITPMRIMPRKELRADVIGRAREVLTDSLQTGYFDTTRLQSRNEDGFPDVHEEADFGLDGIPRGFSLNDEELLGAFHRDLDKLVTKVKETPYVNPQLTASQIDEWEKHCMNMMGDAWDTDEKSKNRVLGFLRANPGLFGYPEATLTFTTATKCSLTPKPKATLPYAQPGKHTQEEKEWMKLHIDHLMSIGVLRESKSPYASSILIIPKKVPPGTPLVDRFRLACNYIELNNAMEKQSMPVSENIRDQINQLAGSTIFSSIDCVKAFYQVLMDKESIKYTAVTTPFGLYEFTRMPFGLQQSAGTWCMVMKKAFGELENCKSWIDDVLLGSTSTEGHAEEVIKMLKKAIQYRLLLHHRKSRFGDTHGELAGHIVSKYSHIPGKRSITKLIKELGEPPRVIGDAQVGGGLINYLSIYIAGVPTLRQGASGFLSGGEAASSATIVALGKQAVHTLLMQKCGTSQRILLGRPRTGEGEEGCFELPWIKIDEGEIQSQEDIRSKGILLGTEKLGFPLKQILKTQLDMPGVSFNTKGGGSMHHQPVTVGVMESWEAPQSNQYYSELIWVNLDPVEDRSSQKPGTPVTVPLNQILSELAEGFGEELINEHHGFSHLNYIRVKPSVKSILRTADFLLNNKNRRKSKRSEEATKRQKNEIRITREGWLCYRSIVKYFLSPVCLGIFKPNSTLYIFKDGSQNGVGMVALVELKPGILMPVEFFWEGAKGSECTMDSNRSELLALQKIPKAFGDFIKTSKEVIICGDHKNLAHQTVDAHSAKHILALSEMHPFEFRHVKGVDNGLADMLSRIPVRFELQKGTGEKFQKSFVYILPPVGVPQNIDEVETYLVRNHQGRRSAIDDAINHSIRRRQEKGEPLAASEKILTQVQFDLCDGYAQEYYDVLKLSACGQEAAQDAVRTMEGKLEELKSNFQSIWYNPQERRRGKHLEEKLTKLTSITASQGDEGEVNEANELVPSKGKVRDVIIEIQKAVSSIYTEYDYPVNVWFQDVHNTCIRLLEKYASMAGIRDQMTKDEFATRNVLFGTYDSGRVSGADALAVRDKNGEAVSEYNQVSGQFHLRALLKAFRPKFEAFLDVAKKNAELGEEEQRGQKGEECEVLMDLVEILNSFEHSGRTSAEADHPERLHHIEKKLQEERQYEEDFDELRKDLFTLQKRVFEATIELEEFSEEFSRLEKLTWGENRLVGMVKNIRTLWEKSGKPELRILKEKMIGGGDKEWDCLNSSHFTRQFLKRKNDLAAELETLSYGRVRMEVAPTTTVEIARYFENCHNGGVCYVLESHPGAFNFWKVITHPATLGSLCCLINAEKVAGRTTIRWNQAKMELIKSKYVSHQDRPGALTSAEKILWAFYHIAVQINKLDTGVQVDADTAQWSDRWKDAPNFIRRLRNFGKLCQGRLLLVKLDDQDWCTGVEKALALHADTNEGCFLNMTLSPFGYTLKNSEHAVGRGNIKVRKEEGVSDFHRDMVKKLSNMLYNQRGLWNKENYDFQFCCDDNLQVRQQLRIFTTRCLQVFSGELKGAPAEISNLLVMHPRHVFVQDPKSFHGPLNRICEDSWVFGLREGRAEGEAFCRKCEKWLTMDEALHRDHLPGEKATDDEKMPSTKLKSICKECLGLGGRRGLYLARRINGTNYHTRRDIWERCGHSGMETTEMRVQLKTENETILYDVDEALAIQAQSGVCGKNELVTFNESVEQRALLSGGRIPNVKQITHLKSLKSSRGVSPWGKLCEVTNLFETEEDLLPHLRNWCAEKCLRVVQCIRENRTNLLELLCIYRMDAFSHILFKVWSGFRDGSVYVSNEQLGLALAKKGSFSERVEEGLVRSLPTGGEIALEKLKSTELIPLLITTWANVVEIVLKNQKSCSDIAAELVDVAELTLALSEALGDLYALGVERLANETEFKIEMENVKTLMQTWEYLGEEDGGDVTKELSKFKTEMGNRVKKTMRRSYKSEDFRLIKMIGPGRQIPCDEVSLAAINRERELKEYVEALPQVSSYTSPILRRKGKPGERTKEDGGQSRLYLKQFRRYFSWANAIFIKKDPNVAYMRRKGVAREHILMWENGRLCFDRELIEGDHAPPKYSHLTRLFLKCHPVVVLYRYNPGNAHGNVLSWNQHADALLAEDACTRSISEAVMWKERGREAERSEWEQQYNIVACRKTLLASVEREGMGKSWTFGDIEKLLQKCHLSSETVKMVMKQIHWLPVVGKKEGCDSVKIDRNSTINATDLREAVVNCCSKWEKLAPRIPQEYAKLVIRMRKACRVICEAVWTWYVHAKKKAVEKKSKTGLKEILKDTFWLRKWICAIQNAGGDTKGYIDRLKRFYAKGQGWTEEDRKIATKFFLDLDGGLNIMKKNRSLLYVPSCRLQWALLDYVHQETHCAADDLEARIEKNYQVTFKNISSECKNIVANCEICQKIRARQTKVDSRRQFYRGDGEPFDIITCDFVGPLVESDSFRYIYSVTCLVTGFVLFIALKDSKAQSILYVHKVILKGYFGVEPHVVYTDNGSQFTSKSYLDMLGDLGSGQWLAPTYNPEATGGGERPHRQLKTLLSIFCHLHHSRWSQYLPLINQTMNSRSSTGDGKSNYERALGLNPTSRRPLGAKFQNLEKYVNHPFVVDAEKMAGKEKMKAETLDTWKRCEEILEQAKAEVSRVTRQIGEINVAAITAGSHVLIASNKRFGDRLKTSTKLLAKFEGPYIVTETLGAGSSLVVKRVSMCDWDKPCEMDRGRKVNIRNIALIHPNGEKGLEVSKKYLKGSICRWNFEHWEDRMVANKEKRGKDTPPYSAGDQLLLNCGAGDVFRVKKDGLYLYVEVLHPCTGIPGNRYVLGREVHPTEKSTTDGFAIFKTELVSEVKDDGSVTFHEKNQVVRLTKDTVEGYWAAGSVVIEVVRPGEGSFLSASSKAEATPTAKITKISDVTNMEQMISYLVENHPADVYEESTLPKIERRILQEVGYPARYIPYIVEEIRAQVAISLKRREGVWTSQKVTESAEEKGRRRMRLVNRETSNLPGSYAVYLTCPMNLDPYEDGFIESGKGSLAVHTHEGFFFGGPTIGDGIAEQIKMVELCSIRGLIKVLKVANKTEGRLRINLFKAKYEHEPTIEFNFNLDMRLNHSQNEVLCRSGVADLVLVQGPPGTGKSQTITSCVVLQEFLRTHTWGRAVTLKDRIFQSTDFLNDNNRVGTRILICGPTNESVWQLASKVAHTRPLGTTNMGVYTARGQIANYENKFPNGVMNISKLITKDLEKKLTNTGKTPFEHICEEHDIGIIFSTVNTAGGQEVRRWKPVCVIMDEAGMCPEAESLVLLGPWLRRLVLVGDPRQLQACVLSRVNQRCGYGVSLFERLMDQGYPFKLLDTQYRMLPKIAEFSNTMFYQGKIRSHMPDMEKVLEDLEEGQVTLKKDDYLRLKSVVFFDTKGLHRNQESQAPNSKSYHNDVEANAIKAHLKDYEKHLERYTIGVISPYKDQVAHIKNKFGGEIEGVDVASVDSFQGSERDIMIISLTRSNDERQLGFSNEKSRVNVGITRGRYALWVFGNSKMLSAVSIWGQIFEILKKAGSVVELGGVNPNDEMMYQLNELGLKIDESKVDIEDRLLILRLLRSGREGRERPTI